LSRILLVHGWGFDPSLWRPLRAVLPGHAWFQLDLGYFGPARLELPEAPDLVVGHSFGTLWALERPELDGVPLVAVNGFPRFTRARDFPHGTPRAVLDRMLRRLEEAPGAVLRAFHARCGTAPPAGRPRPGPLRADLPRLRDGDARPGLARKRVLACAAADDPLVSPALAREAFGRALRLLPEGGHALPASRPREVAEAIREGLAP
jgi:pimeloyl-[acyl-carrier protein] methyl ester esterase